MPVFRASRIGDLMGVKGLGKTGETFIEDVFLQEKYGFREDVQTKEMLKGHLCERESMDLIQSVLGGERRSRNTKFFEDKSLNICGTPDIILQKEDCIEDIKNSWNIRTFLRCELKPIYYWQGVSYMLLTGKNHYRLIYTLNPTPFELIEQEKKRLYFQFECDEENEDYIRMCNQIDHNNNIITKMPLEDRVFIFEWDLTEESVEKLNDRVKQALKIYKEIEKKGIGNGKQFKLK